MPHPDLVALADRSKRLSDASSVKSGFDLASLRVPFYLNHRLLGVSGESFGAPLMPVVRACRRHAIVFQARGRVCSPSPDISSPPSG
jgi:hypothetical protein